MPASNLNDASEQRVSGKFRAPDADLIFLSSDNVVFKIHSMYLTKAVAMGFPSISENIAIGSEPARLSEPADVLELLFQFIEPPDEYQNYRQPSILNMNPIIFFGLAEAAEKYIVYGAMNICMARMPPLADTYPLEVLNHCFKHGYTDYADRAAEQSISKPFPEIAMKLTAPGLISKWLVYYSKWDAAANQAANMFEENVRKNARCQLWDRLAITYVRQLNKDPSSIGEKPRLPDDIALIKCGKCSCQFLALWWPSWFSTIAHDLHNLVPKFSTIA